MKNVIAFLNSRLTHLVLLAIGVGVIYIPTFWWMYDRWFTADSYYSHGILIPFVSAFLIYTKAKDLKAAPKQSSAWGIWVILLGLLIHCISSLFRIYFTSGFSIIIVIYGIVLQIYGGAVTRIIVFPIAFLAFMVPIPLVTIRNISFQMKMFAAKIATFILNAIKLPAILDGSTIRLRHVNNVVDDQCSGLRSLISLLALGTVFAHWLNAAKWKKLIILGLTVPVAIITNVFRIVFLAVISEVWGAKYATGFTHDLAGYLVFIFAFLMMIIIVQQFE